MKHLMRLLCAAATSLALGFRGEALTVPKPAADPEPPEWSVVVVPELDWTPQEITQATRLIEQLQPDTMISPQACDWVKRLPRKNGRPVMITISAKDKSDVPKNPDKDTSSDSIAKYTDISSVHAVPHSGSQPVNVLHCKLQATRNYSFGPMDIRGSEHEFLINRRIHRAFSEMSGDVVFLFDGIQPDLNLDHWQLPRPGRIADPNKTAIRRAVLVATSQLQMNLPARPGLSPRVPLVQLVTGRAASVDWDVLPVDGGAAVWHSSSPNVVSKSQDNASLNLLSGPKSPDAVPSWMDEYIIGNPALFPWLRNPRCGPSGRRLLWSKGPGILGFPQLEITEDRTGEFDFNNLPHDAVRSPSSFFALMAPRYDEKGALERDGDDGMAVYLADLRARKVTKLYYTGLSGAWPVAATWFTDRYLLISGIRSINYGGGVPGDDPETHNLLDGCSVVAVQLFDLLTGHSYTSVVSMVPKEHEPAFTEKIYFPLDPHADNRDDWEALWATVQASLETRTTPAPITPAEAVAISGQSLKDGTAWKNLGQWPPVESWKLSRNHESWTQGSYAQESGNPTRGPLLTPFNTANGQTNYSLAIRGFNNDVADYSEETPIMAHVDVIATGGGFLPRLSSVHQSETDIRLLVLSGTSPTPDLKSHTRKQWLLLLDNFHHQAWRLDWMDESAPK